MEQTTRRWWAVAVILFCSFSLQAATITAMVQKVTGQLSSNALISFFPSNTPAVFSPGGFAQTASATMRTGSNGWASNNLVSGSYRWVVDQSTRDFGVAYVPPGTGTYDLWSLITSTNVLFNSNITAFLVGVAPGTNILTRTNNGIVTVNAVSSGGSGSGLTTNANQFSGVPLAIKSGALLTNTDLRTPILRTGTNSGHFGIESNLFLQGTISAAGSGGSSQFAVSEDGTINIGQGETVISPGGLALSLSGPYGITVQNNDVGVADAGRTFWIRGSDGFQTNLGRIQSGIGFTMPGGDVQTLIDAKQSSSMVLSNLDGNPFTGYTNKTIQIAANNSLSNIQTMASFYWTNAQASSMALSNLAGLANTVFTNQPVGGTNMSVRTAGGTNFFDTTGQLNNWANFNTNVIESTITNSAHAGFISASASISGTITAATVRATSGQITGLSTNLAQQTGNFTNNGGNAVFSQITASTVAYFNSSKELTNVPTGTGMLTNNGAGVVGYMAIPAGGSGGLPGSNANQFAASTTLTIIKAAQLTNTILYNPTNTQEAIADNALSIKGISGSTARLTEWQSNGAVTAYVQSNGGFRGPVGSASMATYGWTNGESSGMYYNLGIGFSMSGSDQLRIRSALVDMTGLFRAASAIGGTGVDFGRDADGIFVVKNTTIPQTNRTYRFYTSATVGDFMESGYDAAQGWYFLRAITNNSGATTPTKSLNISSGTNAQLMVTSTGAVGVVVGNPSAAAPQLAKVGGTIAAQTTVVYSAGASETNLQTYSVPAHTLTNTGDRIQFRFTGNFAATANGKDLKVIYGSSTILDTTSQIVNTGDWVVDGEIIRTGNTSQEASASFKGAGQSLYTISGVKVLAETNGIATTLKMTSTAAGNGDTTNRTLTVSWQPAP
jgi:hypothetical protein